MSEHHELPSGQYGGGDVIVWDRGTWRSSTTDDPARNIERGELHFDLDGEKLVGCFVLVRRDSDRSGKEQWLLRHKNDDHARPGWDPEELLALDALGPAGRWNAQGHEVKLTNLEKVLFPARNGSHPVTKRDLVRYHALIAPNMLPYLAGRPVNLHRYPDSVERPGFWHKEFFAHAPGWLSRWRSEEADVGETQC